MLATEGPELLELVRAGAPSVLPDKRIVKTDVKGVAFSLTRDSIPQCRTKGKFMNSIVYIVGAIVIVVAILSFLGLR